MFENVFGQDTTIKILLCEIKSGEEPRSRLFSGAQFTAKLTTALELARISSCRRDGSWTCSCEECRRSKSLVNPDLAIIGRKQQREELPAALDLLERQPGTASRYFLCRSIRKILKRFDADIYAEESGKLQAMLSSIAGLFEFSEEVLDESVEVQALLKTGKKLVTSYNKVYDAIPRDIPIFQIRAVEALAHQSPWGRHRTIIIEHADHMQEGAMNALLKVLEEPPEHVSFILTTSNTRSLLPTIRSRLRQYPFIQRTPPQTEKVYSRIFRTDPSARPLEQYFGGFSSQQDNEIPALAELLCKRLLQHEAQIDLEAVRSALTDADKFRSLMEHILFYCSQLAQKSRERSLWQKLETCIAACREVVKQQEIYNMNHAQLFDVFCAKTGLYRT